MTRKFLITLSVISAAAVATALAILTWWLVAGRNPYSTIRIEGNGFGDLESTAAYTRIYRAGDLFWWFYPTTATNKTTRPIVLWLDGVTGFPPSLFANLIMFGPYDVNMNRRSNSWIDAYNLLFVDAPIGTGFSTLQNNISQSLEENADHLHMMLQSFYELHPEYSETPVYVFGQGDGAKLAVALASVLTSSGNRTPTNLQGVIIGSGIISPALVLTKLGFYLEELGYVEANGRAAIEQMSSDINTLVTEEDYESAFILYQQLGNIVNERAGAVAVNMRHIIDKLTQNSPTDYYGHSIYLQGAFNTITEAHEYMDSVVAPAVGITSQIKYDAGRNAAIKAFESLLMKPSSDLVEQILQETEIPVTIYNGNLDAVSNTPGQLEWVNNLSWSGQQLFLNSTRNTLIINGIIEGYFRESPRLTFYWMNVAGQAVPIESPVAMRRVLERITKA